MSAARCRSCQAPIVWLKTSAGKNMPLDLDETGALAVTDDDGSAGRIIVDDARRVHVMGAGEMNLGAGSIHVSHFVTCPQGAEWSGKGKGV